MPDQDIAVHCAHDELVPLEKLVGNPRNPNQHPKKQIELLAKIIKAQGWRAPISVSRRSGYIVRGHGRYAAARLLGCPAAPVDFQDYANEAEEWADLIADNRIAELSDTDDKLLAELLGEVKAMNFDVELAGFEVKEVDELLEELTKEEKTTAPPAILRAASLEDLKPTPEEYEILKDRKFLVEFSGGKDSSAATAWLKTFFPKNPVELMFVDLGADFIGFHVFLEQFAQSVGYDLKVLRSERTIFDAFLRKGNWPMFMGPYCHDVLHQPLDDYAKRHNSNDVCIVRGGRFTEHAAFTHCDDRKSRFREIKRMQPYLYFEPLYYGAKSISESILNETKLPLWEGYSYGNQRTACRVCPGQKPVGYAAIRANYPDVWNELLYFESRFGPGAWHRREDGMAKPFEELADLGREAFEAGGYRCR